MAASNRPTYLSARPALDWDASYASAYAAPEGLGTSGNGITCTGIVQDASTPANAWVVNEGRRDSNDVTYTPSLIQIVIATGAKVSEIDLGALYGSATSIQGVADTGTHFWVCSRGEGLVRKLTKAGSDTGDTIAVTTANGCAWDSSRNRLWVTDETSLFEYQENGTLDNTYTLPAGLAAHVDQLHYDAERDLVWVTEGSNGEPGAMYPFDPATETVLDQRVIFERAQSIEGAIIVGGDVYVCHDGYFHQTTPGTNEIQKYSVDLDRMFDYEGPPCAEFDGTDDYLETQVVPSTTAGTFLYAGAVDARAGDTQIIFGAYFNADPNRCWLEVSSSGQLKAAIGSVGPQIVVSSDVRKRFMRLVLSYDGSSVKVYYNGAKVYDAAQSNAPSDQREIALGTAKVVSGFSSLYARQWVHAFGYVTRAVTEAEAMAFMRYAIRWQ